MFEKSLLEYVLTATSGATALKETVYGLVPTIGPVTGLCLGGATLVVMWLLNFRPARSRS